MRPLPRSRSGAALVALLAVVAAASPRMDAQTGNQTFNAFQSTRPLTLTAWNSCDSIDGYSMTSEWTVGGIAGTALERVNLLSQLSQTFS